jgi:hypothetical protein
MVAPAMSIRELFEVTLPEALRSQSPLDLGYRTRFHIEGAGAWEVDLRRNPRVVAVPEALGGYQSVVYISAEDFTAAMNGANVDELAIRTLHDAEGGLTMLKTIAKGPPFAWPESLRVHLVRAAFFRASEAALVAAFPTWRRPLAAPVLRPIRNPFTREMEMRPSFDPDPGGPQAAGPLAPPFPFAFAPVCGDWWDDLLDMYLLLVPSDADARELRDTSSLDLEEMTDRTFPPVFIGRTERPNVYVTPASLRARLATLSDEEIETLGPNLAHWAESADLRARFEVEAVEDLRACRALARATTGNEALWFWG